MKYYYLDSENAAQGPHSSQVLLDMHKAGKLTDDTQVALDGADSWQKLSLQLSELKSNASAPPVPKSAAPAVSSSGAGPKATDSIFCRNCGTEAHKDAVACLKCGLPPEVENKFCHCCGAATNEQQVMCVSCGVSLTGVSRSKSRGAHAAGQRSRTNAMIFAWLLGGVGGQKFYNGSFGWGVVMIGFLIITFGFGFLVVGIIGIVDAIRYLKMTEEEYDAEYNKLAPNPFKW